MPVEESGNLLILFAAIAEMEGNANFAKPYWKQLEQWAEYLKEKGFDPENQLCTDDFAGHLAHNVNLSAKAICGLGSFAKLCELRGDKAKAEEYFKLAREFAQRWVKEADDGEKFRLAFDKGALVEGIVSACSRISHCQTPSTVRRGRAYANRCEGFSNL